MVFFCRQLLFLKLFYCLRYFKQLQTIESRQKGCFSRLSDDTLGSCVTWYVVLLPAAAFFEVVLLPVVAGNRISAIF